MITTQPAIPVPPRLFASHQRKLLDLPPGKILFTDNICEYSGLLRAAKKLGLTYTSRKCENGGWRVWVLSNPA